MTVRDYKVERELILSDDRYSSELQMWIVLQLIETFKKINGCFPYEMENDICIEEDLCQQ